MNELSIFDNQLPAHLRSAELDSTTQALMGSGGNIKRISIEGSVWRMMGDGKEIAQREERYLNVVIVAAADKVSRIYYEGTYKKGAKVPPTCWSSDGERPDASVENPQSRTCAECPMNVKGSGQGDTKACRYSQRVAVVLDNDIEGDVYQLSLPATSIFGQGEVGKWPLQAYARQVGSRGVPISGIVTEMRFDTTSATPKVIFKPVRFLEADEMAIAITQGKTDIAKQAITMTVHQVDLVPDNKTRDEGEGGDTHEDEAPTRPAVKRAAKKAVKPAEPVVEATSDSDDGDDIPEPTRRASGGGKPAASVQTTDLSAVLDEWDD